GQTNTPADLANVSQVACGYAHTYALKNDGTLVGWGNNGSGQTDTPADLANVSQVACGSHHTYALKNDGTLVGWGDNWSGQTNTPADLANVSQVACDYAHTYALKNDGTLVGWGWNGNGQTNTPSAATNVTQIACGYAHTYALKNDGTLVGWGYNGSGQTNTPADLANVTQVACGGAHTYALKNDGTLVGWGYNGSGQTNTPADLANVKQVACGWGYTYALKNDGTLVGWGDNWSGQTNTPADLANVSQVACGDSHTYAIFESDCDADGTLDSTAVAAGSVPDLNTNLIPDSCDVARGWEEDCNLNNIIDSYEQSLNQTAAADSDVMPRIGFGHAQQWVYASPSLSLNDPVLTIRAYGDFSAPGETLTVTLNGRFVGTFFATGTDKNDCRGSITRTITLPRDFYNECVAAPGGASDAIFDFTTSVAVNADQCPSSSWVRAQIAYTAAVAGDCNANSLLDVCEIELDPSLDANTDGVIDACQGMGVVFLCPGDLDRGGSVDNADLSLLLMSFGAAMPGDPADLDQSGQIDTADLSLILLSFGDC
ncbi:MAG: hypothetical protein FJ292_09720, partial [Planctomycetes bacterium]|nr:hypothetical protein [Planctomycetota bacterium]